MLQPIDFTALSSDELLALRKSALTELTERYSADCSDICSDAMSIAEASDADLDCEIGLHLEARRLNARLDRPTGLFARAAA